MIYLFSVFQEHASLAVHRVETRTCSFFGLVPNQIQHEIKCIMQIFYCDNIMNLLLSVFCECLRLIYRFLDIFKNQVPSVKQQSKEAKTRAV